MVRRGFEPTHASFVNPRQALLRKAIVNLIKFRARYLLVDAYYGKVEILRKVKGLNMCAVVPVRDTVHTRVRHSIRLWAKDNYERRKNRFGDRDCVRDFHTASLYVLARFCSLQSHSYA